MTFWTYLLILMGVLFLTMLFSRLIDYIERPSNRSAHRRTHRAA